MKTLICVKEGTKPHYPGTGFVGHIVKVKPHTEFNATDVIIDEENTLDFIMKRVGRGKYAIYGCDAVYIDIRRIRHKLIRAFAKCCGGSRKDARRWARCMADCYFDKKGNPVIDDMPFIDMSQTYFDDFAREEISNW